MAGCNCNRETLKITYDDLTESVKSQHQDWSPTQIRQETAKIFRPQFRQNDVSRKNEISGKPDYEGTDFTYDGFTGVRFVNGESTVGLLELHERQKRLTPEKYSDADYQTSLLIERAFASGASEVVTSYAEASGQRDIIVMTLDRNTGKGKMRVINTTSDHSMSEIQSIARSKFQGLSELKISDKSFILSDKKISTETPKSQSAVYTVVREVPREAGRAATNTVSEIAYTARSVKRYIESKKADKTVSVSSETKKPFRKRELRRIHKPEEVLPGRMIKEKIIHITPAREKPQKPSIFVSVDKPIARHERKMMKKRMRKEARVRIPITREVRAEKKKMRRTLFAEKLAVRRRKKFTVERTVFTKSRKKNIERKNITERTVQLYAFVKKLIRTKEKMIVRRKSKVEIIQKSRLEKKFKAKEHVLNFSVAFFCWILLINHKNVLTNEYKNSKKENKELMKQEPTPWVLLAIIWYLTMIRESGMQGVNVQPKQKKTKKHTYYPFFEPQGVIFAYAS